MGGIFKPPYESIDFFNLLKDTIEKGDLETVNKLLASGVSINIKNPFNGETPLHIATIHNKPDIIRLLLYKGANANARNKDGRTPLHYVASNGNWHFDIRELLVSTFSLGRVRTQNGWTSLHQEVAKLLLYEAKANVNAKDKDRMTPLHYAALYDHQKVAKLLVSRCADVNAKDVIGNTPLHWAAKRGHQEIVELLISQGADVDAKDSSGWTPLFEAKSEHHKDTIDLLKRHGAREEFCVLANQRIVQRVIKDSEFMKSRARINQQRITSLLIFLALITLVVLIFLYRYFPSAVEQGNLQKVKDCLEKNPSLVNSIDYINYDFTPLHTAAYHGHLEVAELLILKGADVNARDDLGDTPLYEASMNGYQEVAELLILKGADVNARDNQGYTPLHKTVESFKGNRDIAMLLISQGADVNAKDNDDWTPLHFATAIGHREVAELLISQGADINAKINKGSTPLSLAAGRGHQDIVEFLISKDAEVNAKDNAGKTPLHYAVQNGHQDIVDLLKRHGGKE